MIDLNPRSHPTSLLCDLSQLAYPLWTLVKWGLKFFLLRVVRIKRKKVFPFLSDPIVFSFACSEELKGELRVRDGGMGEAFLVKYKSLVCFILISSSDCRTNMCPCKSFKHVCPKSKRLPQILPSR